MDNSHNNNNNNDISHSSGEDSLYSSELKSSSNCSQNQQPLQQRPKTHSPRRQRAMSFLYSISKRLGRRGASQGLIYSSQDDIRSSSTDSFSLSLDRGSSAEKHALSSSVDLSSDGHSSDSSHASSSGIGNEENNLNVAGRSYKQHRHSYEPSCYRSVSALGEHDVADDGDDDDSDNGDDDNNRVEHDAAKTTVYKFSARTPLRGLNLNRIRISTVSRVLQQISSSSSSSTRSLSCNSTPLKCSQQKQQQNKNKDKQASSSSGVKNDPKKAAKPQPQQQRILRQPINYVYLKGMSGLPTRRIPRSSLCCSYACR